MPFDSNSDANSQQDASFIHQNLHVCKLHLQSKPLEDILLACIFGSWNNGTWVIKLLQIK